MQMLTLGTFYEISLTLLGGRPLVHTVHRVMVIQQMSHQDQPRNCVWQKYHNDFKARQNCCIWANAGEILK